LAQTFVIAVFAYPEDWIEHLTWVATLLFILTRGPGAFSIDYWRAPALRTATTSEPEKLDALPTNASKVGAGVLPSDLTRLQHGGVGP
jgi:hypothetical protein